MARQGRRLQGHDAQDVRRVDPGEVHVEHPEGRGREHRGEVGAVVLEGAHHARPVAVVAEHAPLEVGRLADLVAGGGGGGVGGRGEAYFQEYITLWLVFWKYTIYFYFLSIYYYFFCPCERACVCVDMCV